MEPPSEHGYTHWVTWTPMSSTRHSPLSLQLGLFKYLFCIYLAEKPQLGQDGDRAAPHTNLPSSLALTLKSGSILLRPRCAGPTQQNQSPLAAGPASAGGKVGWKSFPGTWEGGISSLPQTAYQHTVPGNTLTFLHIASNISVPKPNHSLAPFSG